MSGRFGQYEGEAEVQARFPTRQRGTAPRRYGLLQVIVFVIVIATVMSCIIMLANTSWQPS